MRKETFTPEELDSINRALTEAMAAAFPDLNIVPYPDRSTDAKAKEGEKCQTKNS